MACSGSWDSGKDFERVTTASSRKETCQHAFVQQVLSRRTTRETAEVPDEVRLIGIAAGGGGNRAALASGVAITLQESDRALKPGDSRQTFRRHADAPAKLPLHVAAGHPDVLGHAIDRHETV